MLGILEIMHTLIATFAIMGVLLAIGIVLSWMEDLFR